MKIYELIRRLEAIAAEHGDVEVYHWNDWDGFRVDEVAFEPASDSYPEGHLERLEADEWGWRPARVVLSDTPA